MNALSLACVAWWQALFWGRNLLLAGHDPAQCSASVSLQCVFFKTELCSPKLTHCPSGGWGVPPAPPTQPQEEAVRACAEEPGLRG